MNPDPKADDQTEDYPLIESAAWQYWHSEDERFDFNLVEYIYTQSTSLILYNDARHIFAEFGSGQ
eukprot:2725939-Prorocentrum_lima.AAC.1